MANDFSGVILRSPRSAPSNSENTSAPTNGVVRDYKPIGPDYFISAPDLVDADAEMYKAAVLDNPNNPGTEYLVWAENTSNIAIGEGADWAVSEGTVSLPKGSSTVNDPNSPDSLEREDGTSRVVLVDNSGRTLANVFQVTFVRGYDSAEYVLTEGVDFTYSQNSPGIISIIDNGTNQTRFDVPSGQPAAASFLRGDTFVNASYTIASTRLWWTNNDSFRTRFSWNGIKQRWQPNYGSLPKNLGALAFDTLYEIVPRPEGFSIGDYLPGTSVADNYSMIRLGSDPGANSIPVGVNTVGFTGVLVVSDQSAIDDFDFSSIGPVEPAAVIGVTNGVLQWNQSYVEVNVGLDIWYVFQDFEEDSTGVVGTMLEAVNSDIYVTPIPESGDRPFISFGVRKTLEPTLVDTEALLPVTVPDGEVYVALSTGRLKFSNNDLARSNPDSVSFDLKFAGEKILYRGIARNAVPQPLKPSVALVDNTGSDAVVTNSNDLFIPDAVGTPGLGVSGILHVPDKTGNEPSTGNPGLRPGPTGLIREVESVGDTILYGPAGAIENLIIVDKASDAPDYNFQIPEGTAYVIREEATQGSLIRLGTTDRAKFNGQQMYFVQSDFKPSYYYSEAKILSRNRGPFTFAGGETLRFALNNIQVNWVASAGTFSAEDVAISIQVAIVSAIAPGTATVENNRIKITCTVNTSVEIGYGDPIDTSAASILGFLPGWIVDIPSGASWVPESGFSYGFFRTGVNLDRSESTPDIQATSRVENENIQDSVLASPLVTLSNAPLRDIPGYDEDIFFQTQEGFSTQNLENFDQLLYRFEEDKVFWIDTNNISRRIETSSSIINLERTNIIGETMIPQISGGLSVSESGGPLVPQTLNEDYLLIQNGAPGSALLISNTSTIFLRGYHGSFTSGSDLFVDLENNFSTVQPGYKLEIPSGDAKGFYLVEEVVNANTLRVTPVFPVGSGSSPVQYNIYEGVTLDVNDEAIVADVVYQDFNHFPEEPFQIRLLSALGTVPTSELEQETNRLVAQVSDAIEKDRPIVLRYGLNGSLESNIINLTQELLGEIANGILFVPDAGGTRFNDEAFSIQVGQTRFTHGTDLIPVASFTPTIPSGTIEYLTTTGELAFADDVIGEYIQSDVYYIEEFLSPSLLTIDDSELNTFNGELNLSLTAIQNYGGLLEVYFVEQMITEFGEDVRLSPLSGSIQFNKPLREGQIVETEYFQADSSGDVVFDEEGNPVHVEEFLPRFIRSEVCTRLNERNYSFNPEGRTIDPSVEPTVYVDADLQNFANQDNVGVDYSNNNMTFTYSVPAEATVTIGYAVYESFSGDVAYTVSTTPVYRKPFFLEKEQDTFELISDRTLDMVPGKMMRLGNFPTYIKSSAYDASTDRTTVQIFPRPISEAGSRAPGNDVLTLITGSEVTTVVDPSDPVNVPDANAGLFADVNVEYETVNKGSLQIRYKADLTQVLVIGSILEIAGYPFIIADFSFDGDIGITAIDFTYPAPRPFVYGQDDTRVTIRPIYPPQARDFLGINPVVATEDFELILFGETDSSGNELPGRVLVYNRDYSVDFDSGNISLLAPNQAPLGPGQTLYFRYTRQRNLFPTIQNGVLVYPRFTAGYSHITIPSDENGYLGRILRSTYTFESPDSFYNRIVSVEDYVPEVVEQVTQSVQNQNPHGGPINLNVPNTPNYEQGSVGLLSQRNNLVDNDRVGREFISFYNRVVLSFDHINETINGEVVGDRSGKFRFFIGKDRQLAGPGYEDPFTGELNNRNVWSEVFQAESAKGNGPFTFLETDYIVEPLTANVVSDELTGRFPNGNRLSRLRSLQSPLIQNDIDDIVLSEVGETSLVRVSGFTFNTQAKGIFSLMGEPQNFSRLYPETVNTFTTTYPGVNADSDTGDEGFYTYGRTVTTNGVSERVSTNRTNIGTISNPVLGVVPNLSSIIPSDRRSAARIWAYSNVGFPELDSIIGTTFGATPRPAVIASVVPLSELPIDSDTGYPDFSQLVSQGGDVDDLATGDYNLSRPPWETFDGQTPDQIGFGRPEGDFFDVGYKDNPLDINGILTLPGVYVDEVIAGSVITFREDSGPILGSDQIVELQENSSTGNPLVLEQGDTILVIPRTGIDTPLNDPPTQADIELLSSNLPTYRVGFDIGVSLKEGQYFDITYPSEQDPSYLAMKEILGQRPPGPLTTLEGIAQFTNTEIRPLDIPALQGQALTDSGDKALPYLSIENTEIERLGQISQGLLGVYEADTPIPSSVYPNEILDSNASVVTNPVIPGPPGVDFPAVMLSQEDLTPVATAGSYTPNSAIGDIQNFDLVLVETDDARINPGAQGILSVGSFEGGAGTSYIEPPRFVTPARTADRVRYTFENVMVHVPGTGTSGVVITESGPLTLFNFSTIANFELNDGTGVPPVGGLNDLVNGFLAFPNNNVISMEIYITGGPSQTVTIQGNQVTGNLGTQVMPSPPLFRQQEIEIPAVNFFDFGFYGGVAPGPIGPFDVTISIDTYNGAAVNTGSYKCEIQDDRLTFADSYDLRNVGERGLTTTGGFDAEGKLNVVNITGPLSEDITVNEMSEVNGGVPFTFLRRPYPSPNEIGFFTPGSGGSIKVMAFEGYGNTPLTTTQFTMSAIPSSDQDENGIILNAVGECDHFNPAPAANVSFPNNKILGLSSITGALSNIEPYDMLAITSAADPAAPTYPSALGSTKTGTYLVRHAVESDNFGLHPEYRETNISVTAGVSISSDWLKIVFPRITNFDSGAQTITVDSLVPVADSPTTHSFASPGASTRVYVVKNSTTEETLSARYTAIASNSFTLTDYEDSTGAPITSTVFFDNIAVGEQVSGMVYFNVQVGGEQGMPENNTVGYDYGTTPTEQGFLDISLQGDAGTYTWNTGSDLINLNFAAIGPNDIGVQYPTPNDGTTFINDENATFFNVVTRFLDFSENGVGASVWSTIRTNVNAECILPGDVFLSEFHAEAGIFLEPSVPHSVFDLSSLNPHVVDASNSLTTSDIGFRDATSYGIPFVDRVETVAFEVRRIRRFHEVQESSVESLEALNYIYKIRRGTIDSYVDIGNGYSQIVTATSENATNVGPFDDVNVNINPGDTVRILDSNGDVLEVGQINSVDAGDTITLAPPLLDFASGGVEFEIFLNQAPVPHEQSNKELFEAMVDEVLVDTVRDYTTQEGAFVSTFNNLQDTNVNGISQQYGQGGLGVEPGDYIVVDPAGQLEGPTGTPSNVEFGARPFGDYSTASRAIFTGWEGKPSELDDNRGYYRISEVQPSILVISEASEYAGVQEDASDDVLFSESLPSEYVIYPTVHNSGLTGDGREGQQALRPTALAGTGAGADPNSFLGNDNSVGPFSYKVIRPSTFFSQKAVETILMQRERMLSWIESIDVLISGSFSGSYFVFQRDEHINNLGTTGDPNTGDGVLSNGVISGVLGLFDYSPFANNNDCLSVLDRRFWIKDERLDSQEPPFNPGTPYADLGNGVGRPVYPDHIEDILDNEDQFRQLRYSWIDYRTNQRDGTIFQIRNFDAELPNREAEQKRLLLLKKNTGE